MPLMPIKMTNIKTALSAICLLATCFLTFSSCSDDEATSTYSKREYVYCYFQTIQYAELIHVMGNLGQYATVRKKVVDGVTKIQMTSQASTNNYTADALTKDFGYGLGGLIVGTNNYGESMCFDLACPICDRADKRLTLYSEGDGYAKCSKCGVTFDMNNYGAIYHVPEGSNLTPPRGLYRYRIRYDGSIVNAYN